MGKQHQQDIAAGDGAAGIQHPVPGAALPELEKGPVSGVRAFPLFLRTQKAAEEGFPGFPVPEGGGAVPLPEPLQQGVPGLPLVAGTEPRQHPGPGQDHQGLLGPGVAPVGQREEENLGVFRGFVLLPGVLGQAQVPPPAPLPAHFAQPLVAEEGLGDGFWGVGAVIEGEARRLAVGKVPRLHGGDGLLFPPEDGLFLVLLHPVPVKITGGQVAHGHRVPQFGGVLVAGEGQPLGVLPLGAGNFPAFVIISQGVPGPRVALAGGPLKILPAFGGGAGVVFDAVIRHLVKGFGISLLGPGQPLGQGGPGQGRQRLRRLFRRRGGLFFRLPAGPPLLLQPGGGLPMAVFRRHGQPPEALFPVRGGAVPVQVAAGQLVLDLRVLLVLLEQGVIPLPSLLKFLVSHRVLPPYSNAGWQCSGRHGSPGKAPPGGCPPGFRPSPRRNIPPPTGPGGGRRGKG